MQNHQVACLVEQRDAKCNRVDHLDVSGTPARSSASHAAALPSLGARPSAVVLDPARAGCHPDVLRALLDAGPARIVYVSCDPSTLARDLRTLLAGGYAIESMALADLFPQTFHLETVVRLRRT